MSISKVVVVDGNNLTVRIDRGVAGRSVTDVQAVEINNALFLVFTFSDGTTETVGPVGVIQYVGIAPIVVDGINISLTTVPVNLGGTGQVTANAGFNALAPAQAGNANKYLKSDGTNSTWDLLDISTADITGVLPIANGGTNATTAAGARTSLNAAGQETTISAGTGLSGGGSLAANRTLSITNTAVSAGLYGSASAVASVTVNAQGQLTAATNTTIAITNTQVSGLGTMSTQNANSVAITGGTATLTSLTVNDNTTLGSSNTDNVIFNARIASEFTPATNNTYDLGSNGREWRDLFIDGTANIDSLVADTADINGGTIDGATIGASVRAAGSFTTLDANGNVTLGDATADTITANGRFNTDVVPSTNNARDLGTAALQWRQVFATTLTENASPVVVQTDIGTAPNEIPLNQYLGNLAYQDAANIAGPVGVISGTAAAPAITSATDTNTGIFFPAADTIAFSEGGVEAMRITDAGNVGIGTSSPGSKLEVADFIISGSQDSGTTGSMIIRSRESSNVTRTSIGSLRSSGATYLGRAVEPSTTVISGFNGGLTATTGGGAWVIDEAGGTFFTAFPTAAMTKGSALSMQERLRITSAGNVGIGTSSPSQKIEVSGNSGLGAGTGSPIAIRISDTSQDGGAATWNTTTDFTQLQFFSADASAPGGANIRYAVGAVMENTAGQTTALTFRSSSSGVLIERMRITSEGNVGIGTSSPGTRLTVGGPSGVGGSNLFQLVKASGFGSTEFHQYYASASDYGLNFGLGVSSATDGRAGITFRGNASTSTGMVIFNTNNTERMRITSAGNVGIGVTAPGDKLEIGGAGAGIILASPNGTRYRITVNDAGVITAAAV